MSTLKVNKIRDTAGSADSITLDPNGGAVIAGVTTVSTVKVGSGVTITSDGNIFHTGVCTATSFAGEIPAASIVGVATAGFERSGGFPQGLNASYAKITDTKGTTTQGGTFTSGDWRTRDLQTEDNDDDGIVSISSNQFTLQAGTYHIDASCCAVGVDNHSARIYNVTDSSTTLTGLANKNQEDNVSDYAHVRGQFTIAAAKTFELQHRCYTTVSTHGFGAYSSWNNNVYSIIEIHKRN